ncbi:HAMP domain-containing sensor histidine kinase [Candidatus Nitronereus thalassa]|uniref:histidine kinase n=1 Tax=Candidatus Nitronereus thalassa TaxID=3020898 RepID=A0ABU3K9S3_9BACT|nr:HAMP domain-containing sensor histidine kinase [Candidatus Nitronereus thalassa]MDT7043140.1 HAMP domain-containing sensor histidine kinase [Candidatus Nitronereus thalassa]
MNKLEKERPIQETLFQEPTGGHPYKFFRANVNILRFTIIGLLIFLGDLALPQQLALPFFYVFVILMAWQITEHRGLFLTSTGYSILIALGALISPALRENHTEVLNRILAIALVWSATFFLFKRKKEARSSQVALQQKTTELEQTQAALNTSLRHRQKTEHDLADLNRTLVEQNQELETIVSVASHDLRSPLVNIQGFSKELANSRHQLQALLESHKLAPGIKQDVMAILEGDIPESLHYIQTGAKKMESLVQGILRFSRLGRLTLHFEDLNMNAMITSIIMSMEYQLKEKGVSLQIEDLPNCTGDATLVNQLFFNLLDNAQKYTSTTRPGMIRIMGVREGEYARYRVEDNGIGIRQDHQERIFQMFHQLNPTSVGGEGLGLTIVRRIVERHKGRITLDSQLDCGTTFTIDLPA